ncbi:MAG: transposase [Bacteroidetes bacterium]|nr:transposase [Bacteroidota bacterium]
MGVSRSELLNAYVFKTLAEVQKKTRHWKHDYNHHRLINHWVTKLRWNYKLN